jgi:hypothetical protein
MRMFLRPFALGIAVTALAAGTAMGSAAKSPAVGVRAAAPAPGKSAPAAPAVTATMPKPPKGYVVVHSGNLTANTGAQTRGTVACPAGTVAFGGGAFTTSTSTNVNINSSFPPTTGSPGWAADLNNASGAAVTFSVYAVCANAPKKYTIADGFFDNPSGLESTGSAACPAKTVLLGGGSVASSLLTSVNINSTLPSGNGWQTDMNNGGADSDTFLVYAICGKKPKGYTVVSGTATVNGAGLQTPAEAVCPAPTVPLSGGAHSSLASVIVNLNSSAPVTGGWLVYEDNASASSGTVTPYAICAGK